MDFESIITLSAEWINQSDEFVGEPLIPGENRYRLPGACFHLTREHHSAIVYLVEGSYYGSALAMIRPLFESYIRGIWLFHCATSDQLELFADEDKIPGLASLLSDLESKPGYDDGILKHIRQKSLSTMHGFTHGGIVQLARRVGDGTLEPNYQPNDVFKAVDFANAVGGLARIEILHLASLTDRSLEYLEMFKQHVNNALQPSRRTAGL